MNGVAMYILIDTRPRAQWDFEKNDLAMIGQNKNYINELVRIYNNNNFKLTITHRFMEYYTESTLNSDEIIQYKKEKYSPYNDPTLLVFRNDITNQVIKYYISTNILYNMNDELKNDIYNSDTLYVSGYFPDVELLDYLSPTMINFVGDINCSNLTTLEDNDIFVHRKFKCLYLFYNGFIKCNSIAELEKKRIIIFEMESNQSELQDSLDSPDSPDSPEEFTIIN